MNRTRRWRSNSRIEVLLVARFALVAVSFVILAGCDETMRANYATASEARSDGAVQRGWIPDVLPDSATGIAEAHDLDTNSGEGSFQFGAIDSEAFRAKLQQASSEVGWRHFHDFDRLKQEGYSSCTVPGFVLLVNWEKRHVYFVTDYDSR
jgi:hypothetical protein